MRELIEKIESKSGRTKIMNMRLAFPSHEVAMKIKDLNTRDRNDPEKVRPELLSQFKKMYKAWSVYMKKIRATAKENRAFSKALYHAEKADSSFKSLLKNMKLRDFVNLNARVHDAETELYNVKE